MRSSVGLFVTLVGIAASGVACDRKSPEPAGSAAASASASSSAATAESSPPSPLAIPSADVAAVVNPDHMAPYDGPVGSIEGTVLVQGPESPNVPNLDVKQCPAALDTYGKLFRSGAPREDGLRPLADAVLAVTGYKGFIPEKNEAQRVVISRNCGYPTRTIALTFGQRLEIANDAVKPFAPYLEGTINAAVMIAPPKQAGQPINLYPPRADYYPLKDRIAPFVRGDVYVLRQPLHAVSDVAGHFRIDGVPVGKVKIGARLAPIESQAEKDVEVRQDVVENVELVLTYAPKPATAAAAKNAKPGASAHPRGWRPND
jgi:hypothetical protein